MFKKKINKEKVEKAKELTKELNEERLTVEEMEEVQGGEGGYTFHLNELDEQSHVNEGAGKMGKVGG